MIKSLSTALVAALLTACGGGGGGGTTSAVAPASAAPPPPASTAPVLATPPAASGVSITTGRMNTDVSANSYQVNFNGATDLTVGGNLNNFWIGAAQPGGTVTVTGASNTIVFKPSATPATVTVTGSANTFYIPEGSAVKLTGPGAAMSTVKYYKP